MNTPTITDSTSSKTQASIPGWAAFKAKISGIGDAWSNLFVPGLPTAVGMMGVAFMIYIVGVPQARPLLALPFIGVFIYGILVDRRLTSTALFWFATTALCCLNLYFDFYRAANHHFVLTYMFLVFAITFLQPKEEQADFARNNVRWLLAVLFFFVTFQKAMSPEYLNGSFFGYMFIEGGFFDLFHGIVPGFYELVETNEANLLALSGMNPQIQSSVALAIEQPLIFQAISIAVALMVVLFEFLTMMGLVLFSKGKLRHYLLIMTIIGVAISRAEGGFLSLLCVGGFILCTEDAKGFRGVYMLLFLLFSGLVIINWMYH